MTPNEQAFIDAFIDHAKAYRAETESRHKTYELEKISFEKLETLNEARTKLLGHNRMLNSDTERNKLFELIEEAKRRMALEGR